MNRVFASLVLACASILFVPRSAQAVTIEMVPVGNPGNAPDTRYDATGFGSVASAYQIGKYEVTAGQYTEFLNAVAKDDPNGLYNTYLALSPGANIQRRGASPNFSYSVAADWENRPVNYVSIWDAVRFANWLHNGMPTGPQGPGTTEGGAYHDVGNQLLFGRSAGAKFFIPSEDEWYKAAYHDKNAGLAASYFDFPTGTNAVPGIDITESTSPGNNANYYNNSGAIGSPHYRTVIGEFELSDSPYTARSIRAAMCKSGRKRNWGVCRLLCGAGRLITDTSDCMPPYATKAAEPSLRATKWVSASQASLSQARSCFSASGA